PRARRRAAPCGGSRWRRRSCLSIWDSTDLPRFSARPWPAPAVCYKPAERIGWRSSPSRCRTAPLWDRRRCSCNRTADAFFSPTGSHDARRSPPSGPIPAARRLRPGRRPCRYRGSYSPSGNMTRHICKVVGLGASGVPPEWDLMVVTDAHHATLWVKKMHQPFDYKSIGVDPKAVQYDNGSVSFANQFVLPAYNKQLVPAKDAPKTWEDLLNPKWKGKIGVSSATHHMARLAAGPWGEEKATHFVKALTKQDLILGRL